MSKFSWGRTPRPHFHLPLRSLYMDQRITFIFETKIIPRNHKTLCPRNLICSDFPLSIVILSNNTCPLQKDTNSFFEQYNHMKFALFLLICTQTTQIFLEEDPQTPIPLPFLKFSVDLPLQMFIFILGKYWLYVNTQKLI